MQYEEKYGYRLNKDWSKISLSARHSTNFLCCDCKTTKATETHHAAYYNEKGQLIGFDDIGQWCFPLCRPCHEKAHLKQNWVIVGGVVDSINNRNTEDYRQYLIEQYKLCRLIQNGKSS